MKIGLIDVDSHNFPNLCLMKLSEYHTRRGDRVEWWSPKGRYDLVYKSRVFTDTYSKDTIVVNNAEKVIQGGTGYGPGGKDLPYEIEHIRPDYFLYVKEIDPGLHALQAEVGGDIAASYPFDDPVGLVLNDEGKLIGLDLNRSLRDEHGEIYDIVAGTFLVVGLGEESFTSLPPELAQKYMEHFKQPEQFINLNGQIVALPVEPENPLRTAEMTLEDDYGMIDGIINNGRRGEELEKAQDEARRTTPEKKPSIRERLEDAKRECGERKPPDKAHQKKPPELGDL